MIQDKNRICRNKFMKIGVICILLILICSGCGLATKKYKIPPTALFMADGQDGYISDMKGMNKDQKYYTDIQKTDDGGILFFLTKEQKENTQSQYLKNIKSL